MRKQTILISICSLSEFKRLTKSRLKRAELGLPAREPVYRLYFTNESTLFAALTPKRMELMRFLKKHGPLSHRQLAIKLNRAYANVHDDVKQLLLLELIRKNADQKLIVPWDELSIAVPLAA